MQGRIIKLISNDYTVSSNNDIYICKSRGKFRNMNISPLVGDIVEFDPTNKYILSVYPRKNELIRPPVSNIDQVIIVTSVKHPDFDSYLLDKLITIIEYNNIKPVIYFSKIDLLNEEEYNDFLIYSNYYKKIGYDVYLSNNIEEMKSIFNNKISVVTGQSGAGKSTLLNKFDISLNIKTDEISVALGRGKHTTRHVELLPLLNGLVADTPGFSSVDFIDMKPLDIRDNFIDFNIYRDMCKYKDCMHNKEDNCVIKEKVYTGDILKERYDNYIKFINSKK